MLDWTQAANAPDSRGTAGLGAVSDRARFPRVSANRHLKGSSMLEADSELRSWDISSQEDAVLPDGPMLGQGECILVYDAEGICRWASDAGAALLGLDLPEVVGSRVLDLRPERFRHHTDAWRRVTESRKPCPFLALLAAEGRSKWVGARFVPVLDGQGAAGWVVATIDKWPDSSDDAEEEDSPQDDLTITHAIADLATSALNATDIFEQAVLALGRLIQFDRATAWSVDRDQTVAALVFSAPPQEDASPSEVRAWLEGTEMGAVVRTQTTVPGLGPSPWAPGPGGEGETGSWICTPVVGRDAVVGVLELWRSASRPFGIREQRVLQRLASMVAPRLEFAGLEAEMHRLSEEAVSTQERLVESDRLRSLGELASGVAHDLNNFLAAALARTQILMSVPNSEDQLSSLRAIEQATHDAADVVRRILEFGRRTPVSEPIAVDLSRLAEEVVALTRHKWSDEAQRDGRRITVSVTVVDPAHALGSYSEVKEVLANMVINACEAIEGDGAIEIAVGDGDGKAFVSVSDTGPGIPSEMIERIFEPFFSTKLSGTGLGLSIAREIASRHGGAVEIESEEGKGSTVVLTLPKADPPARPASSEPVPDPMPVVAESDVLVIDDEAVIGSTLADVLSFVGHRVSTAIDGEEGLSMFHSRSYDLVMTDLGMPGLTGWDVVKDIRSSGSKVPGIMVTGWATSIDESQMREHQVDRVLTKPFEVDEVLRLVQELLAQGGRS